MSFAQFCLMLFDPRGRINRKGLLMLALGGLALQLGMYGGAFAGVLAREALPFQIVEVLFLWIAVAAAIKRLHDIGYSGLWILTAIPTTVVFSVASILAVRMALGGAELVPGTSAYLLCLGLTTLPVLLATLWLHFKPGQFCDNRFGAQPGPTGYSGPLPRGAMAVAA